MEIIKTSIKFSYAQAEELVKACNFGLSTKSSRNGTLMHYLLTNNLGTNVKVTKTSTKVTYRFYVNPNTLESILTIGLKSKANNILEIFLNPEMSESNLNAFNIFKQKSMKVLKEAHSAVFPPVFDRYTSEVQIIGPFKVRKLEKLYRVKNKHKDLGFVPVNIVLHLWDNLDTYESLNPITPKDFMAVYEKFKSIRPINKS